MMVTFLVRTRAFPLPVLTGRGDRVSQPPFCGKSHAVGEGRLRARDLFRPGAEQAAAPHPDPLPVKDGERELFSLTPVCF